MYKSLLLCIKVGIIFLNILIIITNARMFITDICVIKDIWFIYSRWELVLCGTCGSQGIHIGCGRLKWRKPEWHCPTCLGVMQPKSAAGKCLVL